MAEEALRAAPPSARAHGRELDLPRVVHEDLVVLHGDAPHAPRSRGAHRDPVPRLRLHARPANAREHPQPEGESGRHHDRRPRAHVHLDGRLHGSQGRDAHAPPRLYRARLRDSARPDGLHPSPPRGRSQAALQASLPVGRGRGGVPRGNGGSPQDGEAATAHREQERRHAVLPLLGGDVRPGPARRKEAGREPVLPGMSPGFLQALGEVRAPLLVLQQPLLPPCCRAGGRPRRPREDEVVRRLPRPRRSLHGSDGQGHDGVLLVRPVRGAAGAHLHVVPFDRRGEGRPRQRRLRRRGEQAVPLRVHEEQGSQGGQQAPHPDGALPPPPDFHEAVHADAGVLRDVPQGGPPPAAQRLPLAARPEPLRRLVRLRRLGRRRPLLLRPAADEGLPRLPSAADRVDGVRQPRRKDPRPPLPRREHGAPGHPERPADDRRHPEEDPRRLALDRHLRHPPRQRPSSRSAPRCPR